MFINTLLIIFYMFEVTACKLFIDISDNWQGASSEEWIQEKGKKYIALMAFSLFAWGFLTFLFPHLKIENSIYYTAGSILIFITYNIIRTIIWNVKKV